MSSISSRAQVQSVSSTILATAVAGGVILTVHLIRLLCSSLSAGGRRLFEQHRNAPVASKSVRSVAELHHEFRSMESVARRRAAAAELPPIERLRVSTLIALAATPYHVGNGLNLETDWRELAQASTLAEAERAQRSMLEAVESSHCQVFANALSVSCRSAAIEIGFTKVDTIARPDGQVRVIATDAAGRTLVSEISSQNRQTAMQTEVVGVADGSCHGILDAFDRALDAQGVRSPAPKRTLTGGVCSLEAAKEFVRRKTRPLTSISEPAAQRAPDAAARRAQRLNSQLKQIIRRRRS